MGAYRCNFPCSRDQRCNQASFSTCNSLHVACQYGLPLEVTILFETVSKQCIASAQEKPIGDRHVSSGEINSTGF